MQSYLFQRYGKIPFLGRGYEIWKCYFSRYKYTEYRLHPTKLEPRFAELKTSFILTELREEVNSSIFIENRSGGRGWREEARSRSRSRDLVQRSLARLKSERRPANICTVEFEDCEKRGELLSRLNWDRREREKLITALQRSGSIAALAIHNTAYSIREIPRVDIITRADVSTISPDRTTAIPGIRCNESFFEIESNLYL